MNLRSLHRGLALFTAALSVLLASRPTTADAPPGRYTFGDAAAAGTVYDTKTKLTWQRVAPSSTYTWSNAKTACQTLSLNGSGWRLPTITELLSIIDFLATSAPYIDPTAFPNTPSAAFWSSTAVVGSTTSAWPVYFDSGFANGSDTSISNEIRCVR